MGFSFSSIKKSVANVLRKVVGKLEVEPKKQTIKQSDSERIRNLYAAYISFGKGIKEGVEYEELIDALSKVDYDNEARSKINLDDLENVCNILRREDVGNHLSTVLSTDEFRSVYNFLSDLSSLSTILHSRPGTESSFLPVKPAYKTGQFQGVINSKENFTDEFLKNIDNMIAAQKNYVPKFTSDIPNKNYLSGDGRNNVKLILNNKTFSRKDPIKEEEV